MGDKTKKPDIPSWKACVIRTAHHCGMLKNPDEQTEQSPKEEPHEPDD